MRKIKLTQGKYALVDNRLFKRLNQFKWCAWKMGKTFYAKRRVTLANGKSVMLYMHREVFRLLGQPIPKTVDHKSRNGLNNQRHNLRPATRAQQQYNQGKRVNNKSGYIGVYQDKETGRWRAQAAFAAGRCKYLGSFGTAKAAARARDQFVRDHRKEFAVTNKAA